MSQRSKKIRERIEPRLSELLSLYEATDPEGGPCTEGSKLENARRAIDLWWYLYADLILWAQSQIVGNELLSEDAALCDDLEKNFGVEVTENSHLAEYVGLQFAFNPVNRDDATLLAVERVMEQADAGLKPETLRIIVRELLMSRSADSSFWRFDLQRALLHLNLGHVDEFASPAPRKSQGNAIEMRKWKLLAVMHVLYRVGKGMKKHRALEEVSQGIGQSVETLRTWEKLLRKDVDCQHEIWMAEVAGDGEADFDADRVRIVDEGGSEVRYRNVPLAVYAKSALKSIRANSLATIQVGLRHSRVDGD